MATAGFSAAARPLALGARPSTTPTTHVLALVALGAIYVAVVPFSVTHLDLARDIGQGLAIARGESFPLEGPVLASTIHFGPLWYYLLALPLAIWPSWLGVALFIGLLAAIKFPLAYALGTRLVDRTTGLLWALLMLYPGWMTLETVFQNHASLVASCTLGLALALLGYLDHGRLRYIAGAGLLLALALHAHPSTAGLAPLVAAAILYRQWRSPMVALRDFTIVAVAAAVPFVPYLVNQARTGFGDARSALRFVGDSASIGSVGEVGAVLYATSLGGTQAIAGDFLSNLPLAGTVLRVVLGLVLVVAGAGLIAAFANRRLRFATIIVLASTLVVALCVAAVRAATPFYMTFVVWSFAAGLVAIGVRATQEHRIGRWLVPATASLTALCALVTQVSVAATLQRGTYPFAFFPLFDVKLPYAPGEPMPFMPARASDASGRVLCANDSTTVHGSYAVHLFHTYAVDGELACGKSERVILLGDAASQPHWVGLARPIARELEAPGGKRLGPVVLVRPERIVHPLQGAAIPDKTRYPPAAPAFGATQQHLFRFETSPDEAVVVTDAYFGFVSAPAVRATANGVEARLVASDRVSRVFACSACARAVKWEIAVVTPAIERVDIVTVRTKERTR